MKAIAAAARPRKAVKRAVRRRATSASGMVRIQRDLLAAQAQLRAQHENFLKAHAQLRESHGRYAELFHLAPIGYVTLSAAGQVQAINQSAADMIGLSRTSLRHAMFSLYVAREDQPLFRGHLRKCSRATAAVTTELRLRRMNGTLLHIRMITAPAPRNPAAEPGLRTALADLTDLKAAEAELRMAKLELESRVQQRTRELEAANEKLRIEMDRRARLEGEVIQISERERRRCGQDLHDDTCQSLAGLSLMVNLLARQVDATDAAASGRLRELGAELLELVHRTRSIARGLHPLALKGGLGIALQELCERVNEKVPCRLEIAREPELSEDAALALYRIAQESTTNAIRHASASLITVWVGCVDGAILLEICDDGVGLPKSLHRNSSGLGLDIMAYRARNIGAELRVERQRTGGTRICCCLPLSRCKEVPAKNGGAESRSLK